VAHGYDDDDDQPPEKIITYGKGPWFSMQNESGYGDNGAMDGERTWVARGRPLVIATLVVIATLAVCHSELLSPQVRKLIKSSDSSLPPIGRDKCLLSVPVWLHCQYQQQLLSFLCLP
jgi:hypothetical protein